MRLLFGSCFTLLIAAALGLGATWFTLTRGVAFGALTVGAWTAWPKSGSADIDPYARAMIARTGELPTGMGDGIAFYAHTDNFGNAFDGRCTFSISGMTPVPVRKRAPRASRAHSSTGSQNSCWRATRRSGPVAR